MRLSDRDPRANATAEIFSRRIFGWTFAIVDAGSRALEQTLGKNLAVEGGRLDFSGALGILAVGIAFVCRAAVFGFQWGLNQPPSELQLCDQLCESLGE